MRIAVVGAGGVGGYFGGRLAQSGQDVTFVARGAHAEAIRRDGLRVESLEGNFTVRPASVTDQPADVGPVDLVVVAVKAWQVRDAAAAVGPMIGPSTIVLPLQNGIEAPRQLADVIGRSHVGGGLCKILATMTGPGCIAHTGIEPYVAFGELDGTRSRRMQDVRRLFRAAGVRADVPRSIQRAMWEKFLLIAPWGGLAALARVPIGTLRDAPASRALLERSMQEVHALAAAEGVDLPERAVEETLAFIDALPAHGTASMQRDVAAGRPSELEAMSGAVVRLGRRHAIETPVNAFVYACLCPLEMQARASR